MPRDIPVGNGKLLVTFDASYQLRDLYFPHVGSENHSGGYPFKFGVWVDGQFRWITDPGWQRQIKYLPDTLVTEVTLVHPDLALELICHDAVDMVFDLFVREVQITNLTDRPRDVRVFFHQDFHIYEHPVGDTAYYEPARDAVLHYKGRRWFLINTAVCSPDGGAPIPGIDQFATGTKEFGSEGTWRDAEDGVLGGNPITQGSVDSCVAVHAKPGPRETATVYYWIAVGTNFDEVVRLNRQVRERGVATFLNRTAAYWRFWVAKSGWDFGDLPADIVTLLKRSLLVLRTQIDNGGAIIAANDTDVQQFARDHYSYMWPRDGALVAYVLDMSGDADVTRRFYDFCSGVMTKEGYLLHKYNPDGSLASSWHPWLSKGKKVLPVQEDETGLVIWALCNHLVRFKDLEWFKPLYRDLVTRGAEWMTTFRSPTGLPGPSWDLWEERYGIHSFTTAAVWAGLRSAAYLARRFNDEDFARKWEAAAAEIKSAADRHLWRDDIGRFVRTAYESDGTLTVDKNVDASLFGLWYFGMYDADDPRIAATMEAIRERLWVKSGVGGVARYENDYYHQVSQDIANVPGNPWFICTLWLAEWHIACAKSADDLAPALEILQWVVDRALPSGVLAEQVHPYTNAPLSVSPLTWSHATFVATVLEYLDRMTVFSSCSLCSQPTYRRERPAILRVT